ncbi:MAG: MFS transporter [Pseudomonadota bacterium]
MTAIKTDQAKSSPKSQRAIIFTGLMIFAMGQTILFALLGPAARDIGFAEWQVGAIISTSAVVFVLISPVWGTLADRWGRKNVIVSGLASYALATLLFAWLLSLGLAGVLAGGTAFASLIGARLLYSLGSGGIQPAAVAMMADLTSKADRSAGVAAVGAAFGLGTVLGPGVASLLVDFGLLVPLLTAAAGAFVIALLAAVFVKDPPRRDQAEDANEDAKPDLLALAPFLALGTGTFVAISAIQQTMSFFIQDFTGTDAIAATKLAGNAFVVLAVATLVVQAGVVQKLKPAPSIMLGYGLPIATLGIVTMALAPSYAIILVGFGIMGAGFGLVQPGISAIVSLATGAEAQGNAAGYVQAAMAGGFVIGPIAGTSLYALSPKAPLMLAIACCVGCYALFGWAVRGRKRVEPSETPTP